MMFYRRQKFNQHRSESILPELSGRSFPSKLERRVAELLCARQRNGEISDLKFQDTVHLTDADVHWRIDFSYIENGRLVRHEAKGLEIEPYQTKLKLYRVYGDAELRITKEQRGMLYTETIFPRCKS